MTTYTVLENRRTLLRIDGAYVGAYDTPELAHQAADAYAGHLPTDTRDEKS